MELCSKPEISEWGLQSDSTAVGYRRFRKHNFTFLAARTTDNFDRTSSDPNTLGVGSVHVFWKLASDMSMATCLWHEATGKALEEPGA